MTTLRTNTGGLNIRSVELSEVELWLLGECVNHYIQSHGYTDRARYDNFHDLRDKMWFELAEMVGKGVPHGCS